MAEAEELAALQERAEAAVELARAAGAEHAWATATSARSTQCQVRDGVLERMQHSHSRRLSVDLYVDGRYLSSSTSDLRDDSLRALLLEAVALARALQPDPFRALPDPALFAGRASVALDRVDPSLERFDAEARLALAQAMNARIAGKPGVLSATSTVGDGRAGAAHASSNGFSGADEGTWVSTASAVTLRGEGDRRPEGDMGAAARHLSDLPDPSWIADEALARARARLGATKGPTTTATLVVDRMAAGRLLGALLGPARGSAVQQGRSFWADRRGQALVSKALVLTDEPLLPRAMGSRLYDDEGIAARPMTVIEGGALRSLFIDTYYARKLGLRPTTGGSSNLVVKPGEGDLAEILADVGEGIYVTSWLGGNSDSTSGEFSLGLRGHLVRGGTIGAPVGEMNVTGNLLELFARLVRVGGDPWTYGTLHAPTLVFEGVSFSGA
jgi:PmbA protein